MKGNSLDPSSVAFLMNQSSEIEKTLTRILIEGCRARDPEILAVKFLFEGLMSKILYIIGNLDSTVFCYEHQKWSKKRMLREVNKRSVMLQEIKEKIEQFNSMPETRH
jgi:hypothetical protein